jgi:hypothetical protein
VIEERSCWGRTKRAEEKSWGVGFHFDVSTNHLFTPFSIIIITTAQETGQLYFCFSSLSTLVQYFSLKATKQGFFFKAVRGEEGWPANFFMGLYRLVNDESFGISAQTGTCRSKRKPDSMEYAAGVGCEAREVRPVPSSLFLYKQFWNYFEWT